MEQRTHPLLSLYPLRLTAIVFAENLSYLIFGDALVIPSNPAGLGCRKFHAREALLQYPENSGVVDLHGSGTRESLASLRPIGGIRGRGWPGRTGLPRLL